MWILLALLAVSSSDDANYWVQRQALSNIPLLGTDGFVAAVDIHKFRTHSEAALRVIDAIRNHQTGMEDEIKSWNSEWVAMNWQSEIERTKSIWWALLYLQTYIDSRSTTYEQYMVTNEQGYQYMDYRPRKCTALEDVQAICFQLNRIRSLIGDQNYLDGTVPDLLPSYRR